MNKTKLRALILIGILLLTTALSVSGKSAHLLDLDFKNADLRDVIRALASQEGVNVCIDNEVSAKITISLTKVTFIEALNIIARNNNLTFTNDGNTYYIKPLDLSLLRVDYAEGLLTVEAREVKLATLFETIAQKSGASLVPAPELQEKVSIFVNKSPLPDAVKTILTQTNCIGEQIGQVTFIRKKTTDAYPFTINFSENQLTIDAKNIPLNVLCRAITEKTGVSVIPESSLNANISVFLQNLKLPDALEAICQANKLTLFPDGDFWRIERQNGAYRVKLKDRILSVDAENVEITEIIKEIARQSGLNIICDRAVRGAVTVHFKEMPFLEGLSILLENGGWIYEKEGDCYYISQDNSRNKNVKIIYDSDAKLFNLTAVNASMTEIIHEMARKADLKLVILPQVNWTLKNVRLQKQSFTQVLDFFLKGTVYTYILIGDTYLIGDGVSVKPESKDFVSVKIYNLQYVKAEQFLNTLPAIIQRQNIVQVPDKNILIVTGPPFYHELLESFIKQVDTPEIEDKTVMEVIKINYMKAEDLSKLLGQFSQKSNTIVVLKEANSLAITASRTQIEEIKSYIQKIDRINPLIVCDILVAQISDSKGTNWNVNSGLIPTNGNELSLSPGDGNLILYKKGTVTTGVIASITALVKKGKAKVLANPTITTLNGYAANFTVSTKYSYTVPTETTTVSGNTSTTNEVVKTYDSGLSISITPWVAANDQITMEIKPKFSEFGDSPEGSTLPSTYERSTETTVRVNNGETFVISGLKNIRKEKSISKIPLLGDIPVLGRLFRKVSDSETQDEFVIVITPSLIYDSSEKPDLKKYSDDIKTEIIPEAAPADETAADEKKKQKEKKPEKW